MNSRCSLCESVPSETEHHLFPGSKDKDEKDVTCGLCERCHTAVHSTLTNKELKKSYNSIEKLKAQEDIASWILWRKKHPNVDPKFNWTKGRHKHSKYS
jgi:hypothetical protein